MTEHEFLKQLIKDRMNFLELFEAFIVDEAHELKKESIAIIAIIKRLIQDNPGNNTKLIVTSATLELQLFQDYFKEMKCATIEAITPMHDVEVFYTHYPDLEINLVENTAAHLKVIFDVEISNYHLAHQEAIRG
jgi:HrpA-like RNA helicase